MQIHLDWLTPGVTHGPARDHSSPGARDHRSERDWFRDLRLNQTPIEREAARTCFEDDRWFTGSGTVGVHLAPAHVYELSRWFWDLSGESCSQ